MTTLRNKDKRQQLRQQLFQRLEGDGVSISQTVKDLRKILGQDQEEFAKWVGLSLSTLRKIEQNQGNVTVQTLAKILDRFSLELVVKRKSV